MDKETPRFFGKAEGSLFSTTFSPEPKTKPPKKFSIVDLFLENKFKEEKKDLNDNLNIEKVNNICKFEDDINEFMGKNKFLLPDDFDENIVKKFLASKEKAFESPV